MTREYFISAPLLEAPHPIRCGDGIIYLRGRAGYSFVEAPDLTAIDDALDDLITGLRTLRQLHLGNTAVVLRSDSEPAVFPNDPRQVESHRWNGWAFTKIPLAQIPLVTLTDKDCELIERDVHPETT